MKNFWFRSNYDERQTMDDGNARKYTRKLVGPSLLEVMMHEYTRPTINLSD